MSASLAVTEDILVSFFPAKSRGRPHVQVLVRNACCRRANTRPASDSSADEAEPGAEASLEKFRGGKDRTGPAMRPRAALAATAPDWIVGFKPVGGTARTQ
jgi:hypothetical protein